MKNIQSKQLAPIPSAAEFDRLMANIGLTVSGLTSGSGGSGSGTTVVNNYNTTEVANTYLMASDCMVRLLFSSPLEEDTLVYNYDPACVRYVAFDGTVAEIREHIVAPIGTTCVDFIFNDPSFPIPNAKIPDVAFKMLELDTDIIPSGIMLLGADSFTKSTVRTLIMQSVTPPLSETEITDTEVRELVVPDVSKALYLEAFRHIERTVPMSDYVSNLIS